MWKTSQSAAPNVWDGEKGAKSAREWRPSEWPPTRSSPCALQAPGGGPPRQHGFFPASLHVSQATICTKCFLPPVPPTPPRPSVPIQEVQLLQHLCQGALPAPPSQALNSKANSRDLWSFSLHAVPGPRLSFGSRDHPISGFLCCPSEITYHPGG